MRDHYDILGIPRTSSDRMVKIAYEAKMKALDDPGYQVPASVRREEERQLRLAQATLSVPHLRAAYDARLDEQDDEGEARGWVPRGRIALVAILLAVSAGAWLLYDRVQSRERAEIARAEKAEKDRREARWRERVEANEARREAMRQEEEAAIAAGKKWQESSDWERERALDERRRQAQEAKDRAEESNASFRESQARAAREQAERQSQRAEEEKRRAAQAEVDRQKAYLRSLEQDEERARAARHEQAQREALEKEYRRQLEERQKQLAN